MMELKNTQTMQNMISTSKLNIDESTTMIILANGKTECCLRASVGIRANLLYTTSCLLDSGARPNILSVSFYPASWVKKVMNECNLNLRPATEGAIISLKHINLFIILDHPCIKAKFIVMETLPVKILIKTAFIDKYIVSIYLTEKHHAIRVIADSYPLDESVDKASYTHCINIRRKRLRR